MNRKILILLTFIIFTHSAVSLSQTTTTQTLIPVGDTWKYLKGEEVVDPAWNALDFNDSTWLEGPTGIGYGDNDDATVLSDMKGNYLTVYARKEFSVEDVDNLQNMVLNIRYDDGFIAYINGQEVARGSMPAGVANYLTLAIPHEAGRVETYDLSEYASLLREGSNVFAVEGHNWSLTGSSDFSMIPELNITREAADRGTPLGQTPPNFTVAFIGDQGLRGKYIGNGRGGAKDVLQLIKDEGAEMVIHSGDFAYGKDDNPKNPDLWDAQITSVLGADFPYFINIGNHDIQMWPGYKKKFEQRLDLVSDELCVGDLGVKSYCYYKGLFFILSGVGTPNMGGFINQSKDARFCEGENPHEACISQEEHIAYIKEQLERDKSIWRVCAWHKNQREMQVGGKQSEVDWGAYEACREGGAMIVTGHEHSYSRTKTLSNFENLTVDDSVHPVINGVPGNPDHLVIKPGASFSVVSGIPGLDLRNQNRCLPYNYPYGGDEGCNYIWGSIYSRNQGEFPGAFFVTYYVDGDPKKARGYFKNINNEIVDSFKIYVGEKGEDSGPNNSVSIDLRLQEGSDDAEQAVNGRFFSINSTDLELTNDGVAQRVGLQWEDVPIPQGAVITKAYIEFVSKDNSSEPTTNVQFRGHAIDNAPTFVERNINSRWSERTSDNSKVRWNDLPAWTKDQKYQTPDISGIVQEIVGRPGWTNGNSMVIFLYGGSGLRRAWSRNGGGAERAPLLHIEYSDLPEVSECPWSEDHSHYCRDCGPCAEGVGDCDFHSECQSGLECHQNVGAKYGKRTGLDVCEAP